MFESKKQFVAKALITELIGTFLLVFIGGIILTQWPGSIQSLIAAAFVYGALIAVLNYSLNCHGGTHLNPAVTLGFLTAGRMCWGLAIAYIVIQLIAALIGVYFLLWFFPSSYQNYTSYACGENSLNNIWKSIVLSTILTIFFVVVFLFVTKQPFIAAASGLAIGVALAITIFAGQGLVGDFINPARSFASSMAAGNWTSYWVVLIGPIIGAVLAGLICRFYMHRFNREPLKDECGEQVYDKCGQKVYKVIDDKYDECGNEVKDECGKKIKIETIEHGNPKPPFMQLTPATAAGSWLKRHGIDPFYAGSKASEGMAMAQNAENKVEEKAHEVLDKVNSKLEKNR